MRGLKWPQVARARLMKIMVIDGLARNQGSWNGPGWRKAEKASIMRMIRV